MVKFNILVISRRICILVFSIFNLLHKLHYRLPIFSLNISIYLGRGGLEYFLITSVPLTTTPQGLLDFNFLNNFRSNDIFKGLFKELNNFRWVSGENEVVSIVLVLVQNSFAGSEFVNSNLTKFHLSCE